eukprot:gene14827-5944_t
MAHRGDIKKAFLQKGLRPEERDALRFLWDIQTEEVFGLTQSPFLLGVKKLKDTAVEVFKDAGFELHKWHSNEKQFENDQREEQDFEQSYAKQQLGVKNTETKLLGLHWNKTEDTTAVMFPKKPWRDDEKRSPADACINLRPNWKKSSLLTYLPLAMPLNLGTSACVYAVVHQPSDIIQGTIAGKSRLSKKAATKENLLENFKNAFENLPIGRAIAWTNSKVALHWIRGEGKYKQFVNNRVKKMRSKEFIS